MNKKGMGQKTLIFFILIMVVAVVLFVFAKNLRGAVNKGNRGTGCLTSMTLQTHTKAEFVVTTFSGTDEFCPKYQVEFHDEDVEIFLKDKSFDKIKYDELTNDKVNEIIAEEMRYCWMQFGAGKLDAFWLPKPIWEKIGIDSDVANNAIGMRICSEISFDELSDKTVKFSGLKNYMQTHDITKKLQKEGVKGTYYDYIANHEQGCEDEDYQKGDNCWEEFANDKNIKIDRNPIIDLSKKYFVVFIRKNIKQDEGVLNTYFVSEDTLQSLARTQNMRGLPFA